MRKKIHRRRTNEKKMHSSILWGKKMKKKEWEISPNNFIPHALSLSFFFSHLEQHNFFFISPRCLSDSGRTNRRCRGLKLR